MTVERRFDKPLSDARIQPRVLPSGPAALYALVLAAGPSVPLLFSPWHYNAFELPKAISARVLSGLALLLLAYTSKGGGPRGRWLRRPAGPALTLAGALLAATVFSVDPRLSLWGSYDRQFGFLTWLAPLGLFLAALTALQTPERQRLLLRVLVWSSGPIVLYGVVQALGADPFAWDSDGASAVLGTMGRSNFLGGYLVLIIPLTATELFSTARRWPLAALIAGQVAVLGLTRARAAWVGLLAAAITYGLLWLFVSGRRRLAGRMALSGLALAALLLVLAGISGLPALLNEAGSPAARLTIWRATAPLLAARPLLGYGPDTMYLTFQEVFPPELVYYQGRHLAVDRAHNVWLDLGMSAGLLGLAAFASLLLSVGLVMWRKLRAATNWRRQMDLIAVAAAISGHLTELQLSFETVGTAVVFWLLLAAGAAEATPSPAAADAPLGSSRLRPWKSLPLTAAFIALLGLLTVRPLLADGAYWRGRQSNPASTVALRHYVEATQHWSIEPLYHLTLGQAYWDSGQPAAAISEAVSAAQLRPADAQLWAAVGDLYARWGTTDPTRYAQALAAYRRAVTLAPNTAAYHTALGLILAESGQPAEGIRAIERAVALDATDAVAYGHLARLYSASGRPERAAWAADQGRRWSAAGND